ncbi:hypothetical protein GYB22_08300 [bacterium]|nr:hypothetical protein [bacterium]
MIDCSAAVSWAELLGLAVSGAISIIAIFIARQANAISKKYSDANQQLSEDQIFHDLFTDFNRRYDEINNTLYRIEQTFNDSEPEELQRFPEIYSKLNDFFNLCAEEYFWYKRKRIPNDIWKVWHNGMNYWYNRVPSIRSAWEYELTQFGHEGYYLKEGESFFNEDKG